MIRTILPLVTLLVALPLLAADDTGSVQTWQAWLHSWLRASAELVGLAAVLVMLWGFARTVWSFLRSELRGGSPATRMALRSGLGYFILLGLELLIVADVIETVVAPDVQHLIVLGLTVIIRTIISFSLNWELAQEAKLERAADGEGRASSP